MRKLKPQKHLNNPNLFRNNQYITVIYKGCHNYDNPYFYYMPKFNK